MDTLLRPRRRILENVGRIADQREHALVPDPGQHLGTRRLADHRGLVDLPVAGMKHSAERGFYKYAVPLGNRVRQSDEADLERPQLDASSSLHDVELHLAGEPLLLELP